MCASACTCLNVCVVGPEQSVIFVRIKGTYNPLFICSESVNHLAKISEPSGKCL